MARSNDVSSAALRKAVVYGSVLASFCVEGVSIERVVGVTAADVSARYEHFQRLTSF